MYSKYLKTIYFLIIVTIMMHYVFFRSATISLGFIAPNLLMVIIANVYYQHNLISKEINVSESKFEKQIIFHSLMIRILVASILSLIFYLISGSLHDVEAIDSKVYYEIASFMADRLRNEGVYDTSRLFTSFDDNGYIHIMMLIHLIGGNSILFFRLFQCIIGSITVLFIYRITKMVFKNEKAARISAILAIPFPHAVEYSAVLLKETILVFAVIVSIYSFLEIFKNGFKIKFIVLITAGLVLCASMRFVYLLILLPSFIVFVLINIRGGRLRIVRMVVSIATVGIILYIIIGKIGYKEQVMQKGTEYVNYVGESSSGLTKKRSSIGGNSLTQNDVYRFSLKFGGTALFIPLSMSFPFPTLLKTNIVYFDQTMKWYFVGGILLWNFLSYFSLVGIITSVKKHFKESVLLLFIVIMMVVVLLKGFVITSDRHNLVKESLLLIFAGVGMEIKMKNKYKYFLIFSIVMMIAIVGFSFFKLKARGAI